MALSLSDIIGSESIGWSGTSLNGSITVPASCGAIVVQRSLYTASSVGTISLSVGGNAYNDNITASASDSSTQWASLYPGLSSGTQAVTGTQTTPGEYSPLVFIYLSTNVSASAFRAKDALTDGSAETDVRSFTLSGLSVGDLVLMHDANSPAPSDVPDLPAGWTNIANGVGGGSVTKGWRSSAIVATGATQTCTSQAEVIWSSLSGVAVQQVAGGGGGGGSYYANILMREAFERAKKAARGLGQWRHSDGRLLVPAI